MEHLINPKVKDIEISGIRRFFNMVSHYEDIVAMTIGQPDFPTPLSIKKAGIQAIENNQTSYTHNAGMLSLRKAIEQHVHHFYQLSYKAEEEIIVTVGASQALDITLRTIIRQGDEVLLPGPVYPGYEPLIRLAGGKPVFIDTSENGFKLTGDLIEKNLTSKTKAVILPYPSNPTGVTLSETELREITNVLEKHKLFLLADEIYSELVYDQPHTSIASFPSVRDQVIVINGVSKSHSMTGWRIGYLLAPSWLCRHILKVHQYNVSCAASISQHAALEALTNGKKDAIDMRETYKERRKFVVERLSQMGLDYAEPDGAFYVFLQMPLNGKTTFERAVQLVEEAGVALVPGDAFSEYGQGYMRLSYAYSMDTLRKGLDRLERFITLDSSR
ncbi:aminotransferase A [Halobacillus karajensis]|uniref:Aminotransferase n=1 Tax=Halobacillus karajensis TaxID=195088 RepID=A0A024P2X5_9BACI|nr:aminotransferase A [Halobacillus karajensis]CDQ19943.1 Putative N-acetyl-LL-diaminopimelate aminotransferase [Halobacillus karajensis]CDQ22403.1 Putative N-acetyl-LL-diaminopimelate aminotransferase [Halobacillus karajensis]CDQ28246.1 Putative N-acetyl-LL-diaminopimelate aminotransferase [Halobacillus karajensis]